MTLTTLIIYILIGYVCYNIGWIVGWYQDERNRR